MRDAVKGFGDAACYTGDCVGVAADGDGVADGVLEVGAFQGADNCLRDCYLASLIEAVVCAHCAEIVGVMPELDFFHGV